MNPSRSHAKPLAKADRNRIELFVFPVNNVVFFPTTTIPLNIFEPRYIAMVNQALLTHTPIALCHQSPLDGSHRPVVAGYGTPVLLERRDDGSMVILLKGTGKVRLSRITSHTPYITCLGEPIAESLAVIDDSQIQFARLKHILHAWIEKHVSDEAQRDALVTGLEDPQQVVECMSTLLLSDSALKRLILETDDINDRIHILNPLFNEDGSVLHPSSKELN